MQPTHAALPRTEAVQRALAGIVDSTYAADLLFLEAWERDPVPGAGAARRVAQIRRANPALAEAIRREVHVRPAPGNSSTYWAQGVNLGLEATF